MGLPYASLPKLCTARAGMKTRLGWPPAFIIAKFARGDVPRWVLLRKPRGADPGQMARARNGDRAKAHTVLNELKRNAVALEETK